MPRQLNDTGLYLYNDMRGEDFLKTNKQHLFSSMERRKLPTALDVESEAYFTLVASTREDFFIPLKTYVYNSPMIDVGEGKQIECTLDAACFVLSIPLRDMYLEEHPEIPR